VGDSTPQVLGGSATPDPSTVLFGHAVSAGKPSNLGDWATLVQDLVHHVVVEKHYTVRRWAVWNEPDAPSGATPKFGLDEYLDLYAATARAIRMADPTAQVGGPETS